MVLREPPRAPAEALATTSAQALDGCPPDCGSGQFCGGSFCESYCGIYTLSDSSSA